MAEVQNFGNENGGCQMKTSFVKQIYDFNWTIDNCPPYPTIFNVKSADFYPVSDRLFYSTLERKVNMSDYYDLVLTFSIKEGPEITIKYKVSVTDSTGKVLKDSTSTPTASHRHIKGTSTAYAMGVFKNETQFLKTENYKCLVFSCIMEFEVPCTNIGPNYVMPRPPSYSTLVDDLKAMYTKSLHADLCLKVGEGSIVRVHKAHLCARSPVFAKMFEFEKKKNVIQILDMDLSVVEVLVEFLYTGILCDDDFDVVFDLYYAADKYDVSSLRKTCTDVLLAKLDVENACRVLCLADRHSDDQFKDAVMDYIQFNFDAIVQTDVWSEFLEDETKLAAEVMRRRSLKSK